MTIQLNHTIVRARDKRASAAFLASILGLEVGADFGRFVPVAVANGVTLDYVSARDASLSRSPRRTSAMPESTRSPSTNCGRRSGAASTTATSTNSTMR